LDIVYFCAEPSLSSLNVQTISLNLLLLHRLALKTYAILVRGNKCGVIKSAVWHEAGFVFVTSNSIAFDTAAYPCGHVT